MSIPKPIDLHSIVLQRFQGAFGEPHRVAGDERQWSLRSLAYIAAVNVLLVGNAERPVVWVFDPHDPTDGISSVTIQSEGQIASVIDSIEERVKLRGQPPAHTA